MDQNTLKIATYNIQLSLNVDAITRNILHMAQNGVAVFCLQEVIKQPDRQFIADALVKAMGDAWQMEYFIGEGSVHKALGTGILWNTRLVTCQKVTKLLLPSAKRLAIHEWIFALLIGGTLKPVQRRCTSCIFSCADKTVRITSIHVDHIGGSKHRNKQLKNLLNQLDKENETSYEIVSGDFNTFDLLHTGKEKKLIQHTLGDSFHEASASISWTADLYNMDMVSAFPFLKRLIHFLHIHIRCKLDYIWVKNFTIMTCREIKVSGSDHYPVIAELSFKNLKNKDNE